IVTAIRPVTYVVVPVIRSFVSQQPAMNLSLRGTQDHEGRIDVVFVSESGLLIRFRPLAEPTENIRIYRIKNPSPGIWPILYRYELALLEPNDLGIPVVVTK